LRASARTQGRSGGFSRVRPPKGSTPTLTITRMLVLRRGLLAALALPEVVQQHGAGRDVLRVGDDDAVVANDKADVGVVFQPLGRGGEGDGLREYGGNEFIFRVLFRADNIHS